MANSLELTAETGAHSSAELALSVQHLSTYVRSSNGERLLVDDVSLDVGRGQIVGLVGESGSGKSVTAMSIARLIPRRGFRHTGRVLLDEVDLLTLSERDMASYRGRRIGFVFQDPMSSLNPVLTVGEQIAEPIRAHLGLGRRAAMARVVELLDRVAIPEPERRAREYPFQLSGGLRQRVMIAIALSCDPQVIIADEPTTALDVTVQAQILALLRSLASTSDCGVLLITHDIGVVARVCDSVNVMYAGHVVEHGTVAEVLDNSQMPYTRALLGAMPEMRRLSPGERLEAIEGSAVRPGFWSTGCRFAPRCTHRREACTAGPIPLTARHDTHFARCLGTQDDGWVV